MTTNKERIKAATYEQLSAFVVESVTHVAVLRKLGIKKINSRCYQYLKERLLQLHIDTSHFTGQPERKDKRTYENIFCKDSTASQETLRTAYKKLPDIAYKCANCGNEGIWNNAELHLQLEHKNGDKHDNRIENLCWLCPNCHSQTYTFCGKNTTDNAVKSHHCPCCGIQVNRAWAQNGLCFECEQKISQIRSICESPSTSEMQSFAKQYEIPLDYIEYVFYHRKSKHIAELVKQAAQHQQSICPRCGNPMSNTSKVCLNCHNKEIAATASIPISEIDADFIAHLLDTSYTQIAKEYNVSDNAVRKRIRAAGLPTKRKELYRWYEEKTGHKHIRDADS